MTDVPALGDIHAMSIDKMKDQLGGLDRDQLVQLRGLETGAGDDQQRAGAIAAIDAAIAKLPPIEAGNAIGGVEGETRDSVPGADRENVARLEGEISTLKGVLADLFGADADFEMAALQVEDDLISLGFPADFGDETGGQIGRAMSALRTAAGANDTAATKIGDLEQKLRDAGKPNPGPDPVLVPGDPVQAGPVVKFYDGDVEIEAAGYMLTEQRDWAIVNGATVLNRKIEISRDLPRVTITHVRIIGEDGEPVASCEIPGGLRVGAGVQAELPAQSLAFIATAQPLVDA